MSYCRWSSNNWDCDLYCYQGADNIYITHVATNRIVGDVPKVPILLTIPTDKWVELHRKQMDFLETAKRKNIGLPYDGETFEDKDLQSFLNTVEHLKETGYHVPDFVMETIKEEIKDGNNDQEIHRTHGY